MPEVTESRMSGGARARPWCCCTATSATGECGAPRSMTLVGRVHGGGLGRAGLRRLVGSARGVSLSAFADCLAAFIDALDLGRPHVVGLSFGGGLALELFRRHPALPASLVLASAYAGWAGSLPAEVVEERLQQALRLADLPPDQLVEELMPTMFSDSAPPELVEEFAASMREFHPAGLRANSRAFADADLRDVLPRVTCRPCSCTATGTYARPPAGRARPPRRDSRLETRVHPRSGSRVQHRRPAALQQRGARLPWSAPAD